MRNKLLALLLLFAVASSDGSSPEQALVAEDEGVDLLRVQQGSQALLFVVSRATFGATLPRVSSVTQLGANRNNDDAPLRILRGNVSDDCSSVTTLADIDGTQQYKTAVLLDRGGNCSFVQKALAAQHSGASLMIVRDTIAGAFTSAKQPGGASAYDCSLGKSSVSSNASFPLIDTNALEQAPIEVSVCTQAHTCASGTCILTGKQHKGTKHRFQVCCFLNRMIHMNADDNSQQLAAKVQIPAIFLDYRDAEALEQLMMTRSSSSAAILAQVYNSEESPWNVSMALSWLLGVGVVMSAAYYSCSHERTFSYQKVAQALASSLGHSGNKAHGSNDCGNQYVRIDDNDHYGNEPGGSPRGVTDERMELSGRHALVFLVGASCVLLLVYYVHVLLLISILFAIGASVAMAQVFLVPLCLTVMPLSWTATTSGNRVLYISVALGILISIFWFVERASPYIWPLQNLLCIALCFVFIDTIQLPSLRVGAILLGAAFVYDIFFVYLSPFVFGSNVMVDVASGGGNTRVVAGGGGVGGEFLDHCQRHPEEPECRQHQTMPMVLSIPLLFSFYGGNALLGLGDLIIPGLLVSFCIRYDYCMGYPLSAKYFSVASGAYTLGLLLANTMAILLRNVVAGQPALMYIVPLMLAAVLGFAKLNSELQVMWDGPLCLQMLHKVDENEDDDDPEHGRHDETQPLVTAKANAM